MSRPPAETLTLAGLADRARALSAGSDRTLIGIVGPPGAGKSTVAEALVHQLGSDAVLVPMDGFHLSNEVLETLGRRDRKGAPDTFDADGYIALLRRLRQQVDEIVYAPAFRRDIEEPIGSSTPVPRATPIVVTEGNYLLLDTQPWKLIRDLLDSTWYLEVDETVRLERLIARHVAFGKAPDAARAWAEGSDQANAATIAESSRYADLLLRLAPTAT
ncbi:nucleoside/nucleotide kinase family protein [Micromonospora sp. LH3U1]|uniref:nucleoside/nucleotide kinase family protein n=1 Tax=Micromonospora sp. LH3U1 TaxID=3018339 RepID=UPI00234B08B3|nr:nucleoside/nucleotide kinase family protein [Micromonospora sp. LH3U1]WCN82137.1 nucleoside/nucleotide kinase family protein [Micromonospora sp. LH3U1]